LGCGQKLSKKNTGGKKKKKKRRLVGTAPEHKCALKTQSPSGKKTTRGGWVTHATKGHTKKKIRKKNNGVKQTTKKTGHQKTRPYGKGWALGGKNSPRTIKTKEGDTRKIRQKKNKNSQKPSSKGQKHILGFCKKFKPLHGRGKRGQYGVKQKKTT